MYKGGALDASLFQKFQDALTEVGVLQAQLKASRNLTYLETLSELVCSLGVGLQPPNAGDVVTKGILGSLTTTATSGAACRRDSCSGSRPKLLLFHVVLGESGKQISPGGHEEQGVGPSKTKHYGTDATTEHVVHGHTPAHVGDICWDC